MTDTNLPGSDNLPPASLSASEPAVTPSSPQDDFSEVITTVDAPRSNKPVNPKMVLMVLGLILAAVAIPSGIYLAGRQQDIRSLAATSAPLCPAGTTPIGNPYGECCACDTAKEVRRCRYTDGSGTDTYTEGPCDHTGQTTCHGSCPGVTPTTPPSSGCDGATNRGTGCQCTEDTHCQSKVCHFATCAANCGSFSEQVCYTHVNCHWEGGICKDGPSTPVVATSCKDKNLVDDPTCTANPECKTSTTPGVPSQNGFCCKDSNYFYCCYTDGKCYTGNSGNSCRDNGNGSITMTNRGAAFTKELLTFDCTSHPVCPCSTNRTSKTVTLNTGENTFSIPADKCGQIDLVGFCGSCKATGCDSPPGNTPTPPPSYTINCESCGAYDSNWNQITNLNSIQVGQAIYLMNHGTTNQPQGITKARFKINNGAWQETTAKHGNDYYIQYTVPSPGTYSVDSEIYNPVTGWHD